MVNTQCQLAAVLGCNRRSVAGWTKDRDWPFGSQGFRPGAVLAWRCSQRGYRPRPDDPKPDEDGFLWAMRKAGLSGRIRDEASPGEADALDALQRKLLEARVASVRLKIAQLHSRYIPRKTHERVLVGMVNSVGRRVGEVVETFPELFADKDAAEIHRLARRTLDDLLWEFAEIKSVELATAEQVEAVRGFQPTARRRPDDDGDTV